jgi:hypothetical protein
MEENYLLAAKGDKQKSKEAYHKVTEQVILNLFQDLKAVLAI